MKSFCDLHSAIKRRHDEEARKQKAERLERIRLIQSQKVVGGCYRPKPIDKQAAMLIAKAPWFFHPPENKSETKQENKVMPEMNMAADYSDDALFIGKQKIFPTMKNGEKMYSVEDMARALIEHAKTINPDVEKLAAAAAESRKALDEAIQSVGGAVDNLDRFTKDAYGRVRMQRQAVVTDCAMMTTALRDLRQFFLGPDYEREQKRLADFVDLCERLKGLKDSGFLDTVADTMIRLSSLEKLQ